MNKTETDPTPRMKMSGRALQQMKPVIETHGGIMTLQDLQDYEAITRAPANITFRGIRIFSTIAPSSGAVVPSALEIFEEYPGSAKVDDPECNITTHSLIQATRFGYRR